jgi:quinol monooxygenase YgiN
MTIHRRGLLVFAATAAAASGASTARAQMLPAPTGLPAGSVVPVGDSIVSYIEIMPGSEAKAIDILKALRMASLKDAGVRSFSLFQRTTHSHHFCVLEEWADNASRDAHAAQSHVKTSRDKLAAIETAPYDERPHRPLATGPAAKATPNSLTYVTHVDFVPVYREEGEKMLKMLAEASRAESGVARFDVFTQASRANHMTIVEVWNSQSAWKRHLSASHTRNFRLSLLPRSGSVYDERIYKTIA